MSGSPWIVAGYFETVNCSTPGGVFVGFTPLAQIEPKFTGICSTPGGVFVGFTVEP